jgi:tetratricopeptide (TPR) repeat protein
VKNGPATTELVRHRLICFELKILRGTLAGIAASIMTGSRSRGHDVGERAAFIHQEILKLAILIGVAMVGFFVTRAIAASNRSMTVRDAAEWYARGERALATSDPTAAVEAFRHASVMKRGDRQYTLALARALATTHQSDAAERALLTLRELVPEDPEVNLELARLEAGRGDAAAALRYYHNALYAPWSADQTDARREVRLELIRFLMATHQSGRAESELVALTSDLPHTLALHVEVGDLFVSVGDNRRALDQFEQAIALAPQDRVALAGAGRAAFSIGDYEKAERYLRDLPDPADDVREMRALVNLVLDSDPLAARIGSSARRRRLLEALSHFSERLEGCNPANAGGGSSAALSQLADETAAFAMEIEHGNVLESDTIENGLDLVNRGERTVIAACPPAQTLDRALMLIAARHGVAAP